MTDLRPSFESAQRVFGVDATVTIPGGVPVETVVVWLPPVTEAYPSGNEAYTRAVTRRVLAIPLDDVPEIPRLTSIVAAEAPGLSAATWVVDETRRLDADHHRVVVLPG